jgi:uncharacterized protein
VTIATLSSSRSFSKMVIKFGCELRCLWQRPYRPALVEPLQVREERAFSICGVSAVIAWISFTPVKGLRLQHRAEVLLTEAGVPGDRAFFLVDERGAMVSATRLGPLVAVVPEHEAQAGTLSLRFPDGDEVAGSIELGEPENVRFYALNLRARPVLGAFSAALSDHCDTPVRVFAAPPDRPGIDRGRDGAVTLLSVASLERLQAHARETEPVDPRRFRMTFGVEGLEAHEEDGWIDRDVRIGDAVLRVAGNVGRCALTTRNPDTGVVDFKTLHHLDTYRRQMQTSEPLPFGVHARVVQPGRVRVGDAVALAEL